MPAYAVPHSLSSSNPPAPADAPTAACLRYWQNLHLSDSAALLLDHPHRAKHTTDGLELASPLLRTSHAPTHLAGGPQQLLDQASLQSQQPLDLGFLWEECSLQMKVKLKKDLLGGSQEAGSVLPGADLKQQTFLFAIGFQPELNELCTWCHIFSVQKRSPKPVSSKEGTRPDCWGDCGSTLSSGSKASRRALSKPALPKKVVECAISARAISR